MKKFLNKKLFKQKFIWIICYSFIPSFLICFFCWLYFFLKFPQNTIINNGAIGSLFKENITFVILLQTIIIAIFPIFFIFCKEKISMIGVGILFAGALMNWIDRFIDKSDVRFEHYSIHFGGVIDYIRIGKTNLYANICDIFVIIGILIFISSLLTSLWNSENIEDKNQKSDVPQNIINSQNKDRFMEINANSFQGKKINNDNSKPIKIVLDVMGSDFDSLYAIEGARIFLKKHKDVQITLCGNKENILSYIKPKDDFLVLEANNIIHTHDSFPSMLRNKESSMYKSFEGVSLGKYDGMVSAGTTSAFVLLSNTIIKTLPQITKPAFMSYVPKDNGSAFMFLDVGANLECDASNLHQFAKLGNIYAKTINKVDEPKIYILNIGTEENKGFLFQQEAHKILLQDKSLNYCGFIESRYLLSSDADVVVCDGYTGNVALKALEGSLLSINKVLKQEFKKPWNIPAAILSLGIFKKIKKIFDYKNNAAAFVVGLNKNVCKTHGSAKEKEWNSAIEKMYLAIRYDLTKIIKENI